MNVPIADGAATVRTRSFIMVQNVCRQAYVEGVLVDNRISVGSLFAQSIAHSCAH